MGLVNLHQFLVELLSVILVFFPDLLNLGLNFFHFLHRCVAFVGQRPENYLDDECQQNNGDPVVVGVRVEPPEHHQQRFRQNGKPAVINCGRQAMVGGFRAVISLGPL